MSSPDLHQHHSSDSIGPAKPRLAVDEVEVERHEPPAPGRVPEQPPRHYWQRALVLIFVPTVVTAYFAVIWVQLLQKSPFDEVVKYRTFSGSLIYYSWFIIGVFGLSWSEFGLVGVEASMLCSHFWGAPNLVALLMHANGTWSSPSGWIKAVARREFHRLWCLFAFLSLLPFIAIPLSGLVFEISDGYIKIPDAPSVVGRNSTTFNRRYDGLITSEAEAPAWAAWLLGSAPTIPGLGLIFSGESVDRPQHSVFERLPNSLPLTEPIPDLFLGPQPDKPVSGTAWGLRFKYNCSIVRSASEFTILSQKSASPVMSVDTKGGISLQTPSKDVITLWKSTSLGDSAYANTQAYWETGTSAGRKDINSLDNTDKYDGRHPGFDTDLVFEYAVWQIRSDGRYNDHLLPFNTTIEPSIEGMGSPFFTTSDGYFALNNTFLTLKPGAIGSPTENITNVNSTMNLARMINGSSDGRMLYTAPPIGIRCLAASDLGTAELDGVTSTFGNFQRVNPNDTNSFQGSPPFGRTAAKILNAQYYQHYVSGGLPDTEPGSFEQSRRYARFVSPEALLRSVNLAYALDAFDLMYGVTSAFKEEWVEPGLTSSRPGKILSVASLIPGAEVGYFVLALFCVWAALSVGLGLVYGFRKRPADRLDGYSMLRIGADMAPELIENHDFMSGMPYDDSGTMAAMPGNVSVRGNSVRRA